MLPVISGSHSVNQDTFVSEFLAFYHNPLALSRSTWKTIIEFWYLDLSLTDTLMQDCYSKYDPAPRLPSCMLRSYLLSIKLKVSFITTWVSMLKECPLYAILSSFSTKDTPGIGTFYDFFDRLWQSDSNHLSPKERTVKRKVKNGKKLGEKTPTDTISICSKLPPFLVRHPVKDNHPFQLIFKHYQQQFLNISVQKGLIDSHHMSVVGDGTPVRTSARNRKNAYATVKKMGLLTVTANAYFPSLTATVNGILRENATLTATIYTCSLLLILTVICLFFHCWNEHLDTICFLSYIPSFP